MIKLDCSYFSCYEIFLRVSLLQACNNNPLLLKALNTFTSLTMKSRFPVDSVIAAHTYLLLAECEVRTASYGPSFFLPFMAQARSARAMKTRKEKTRIHNLLYGPSKRELVVRTATYGPEIDQSQHVKSVSHIIM